MKMEKEKPCLHDFVTKFGVYECQNCGQLHEDILKSTLNKNDMTDKSKFISKWSNWWILTKDAKQLNEAFEKELDEVINAVSNKQFVSELSLIDWLEKTKEGRYLLMKITFPIANHFKTHPEKIPVDLVVEILNAINKK